MASEGLQSSAVKEFYERKVVLIVGMFGMVSKALLEKLIRSCRPARIYILIKAKPGRSLEERFAKLVTDSDLFKLMNDQDYRLNDRRFVIPLEANFALPGLGLSEADRRALIKEVQIVFNVPAAHSGYSTLVSALMNNFLGTCHLLDLAAEMHRLENILHVSAAYVACHRRLVEELLYPLPVLITRQQAERIVSSQYQNTTNTKHLKKLILDFYPNLDIYCKALTEHHIKDWSAQREVKVSILRPSLVVWTAAEPVAGWIQSGPTTPLLQQVSGFRQTLIFDSKVRNDLIPLDYVANAALAIPAAGPGQQLAVYCISSSHRNPLFAGQYWKLIEKYSQKYPTTSVMRSLVRRQLGSDAKWINRALRLCTEVVFGYAADLILGTRLRSKSVVKVTRKMQTRIDESIHFLLRDWTHVDDNLRQVWSTMSGRDRREFNFDIEQLDWDEYVRSAVLGTRRFLHGEADSTLDEARDKYRKLILTERIIKTAAVAGFGLLAAYLAGKLYYWIASLL